MWDGCAARWTREMRRPLSTPCAASDSAFVLLSKTLRSSTFRLAILYICLFGGSVAALFGYVYWSTTKYVKQRYDTMIVTDRRALLETLARSGREGLIRELSTSAGTSPLHGDVYFLSEPDYTPIVGNLKDWPAAARAGDGWIEFSPPNWRPGAQQRPLLRAVVTTLPDGTHPQTGRGQ